MESQSRQLGEVYFTNPNQPKQLFFISIFCILASDKCLKFINQLWSRFGSGAIKLLGV